LPGKSLGSNAEQPQQDPLSIMEAVCREMEFPYEEENGVLKFRVALDSMDVQVITWGQLRDVAQVIVRLQVRAKTDFRAQCGEFLHRLNFGTRRKLWEMDYDDGEVRLAAYYDTIAGPLTGGILKSLLHYLFVTADAVFPYLTSVLSGRMTAEFAADQAEAAITALWDDGEEKVEEEPDDS
jgi:hypothetical protein